MLSRRPVSPSTSSFSHDLWARLDDSHKLLPRHHGWSRIRDYSVADEVFVDPGVVFQYNPGQGYEKRSIELDQMITWLQAVGESNERRSCQTTDSLL
jgi:hypothetical protein